MLSNSAARIGSVRTTLRQIGKRRPHSTPRIVCGRKFVPTEEIGVSLTSEFGRWKSTMATYSDAEDESESARSLGHAQAATARSVFS